MSGRHAARRIARNLALRARRYLKPIQSAVIGRITVWTIRLIRRMDPDRVSDLAARVLRTVGPFLPEHRVGRANLTAAYPDKSAAEIEKILLGVWDNLGRMGGEFAHLDRLWDVDREHLTGTRIEFSEQDLQRFLHLRESSKPALVFTAHLANWELPALAAAMHGIDSAVLYRRPNIADVDRAVREIRSINMGKLIPTGPEAPFRLADALAEGKHVGMMVDQYFGRGVDVTFFGRTTKANPLIARLARLTDSPIHGVRMMRLPGKRFRGELTDAIEVPRDAQGRVDIQPTMQLITSIVEGWVRDHPEQWLWLHRRWR
jgi:KDO2-lipid IV(A) lauroyltransferase